MNKKDVKIESDESGKRKSEYLLESVGKKIGIL